MLDNKLSGQFPAAFTAIKNLAVSPTDKILFLTDHKSDKKAVETFASCFKISAMSVEINDTLPLSHEEDFPPEVISLIKSADIIILAASRSWYHASTRRKAKYEWQKKIVECYGLVTPMLIDGALAANPIKLADLGGNIIRAIKTPADIKIKTPSGTDFLCRIENAVVEDGNYQDPGSGGNLPAGEISCLVEQGSANGRIVFDVSCDAAKPGEIVFFDVKTGKIVNNDGFAGLKNEFKRYHMLNNIAEIGIGINKWGIRGRSVLEDEKIFGYVHIGFGGNLYFGGNVSGPHYDGVMSNASLIIGDETFLIKDGEFTI